MKSPRLGLSIDRDTIRSVLVVRGIIAWSGEQAVEASRSLDEQVVSLCAAVKFPPRTRAMAAIGPAYAQVKRIDGVPDSVDDPVVVSDLARSNAARFFIAHSGVRTSVAIKRGSVWWAAAIDEGITFAVERACMRIGVVLDGHLPAVVALGFHLETGIATWSDDDTVATLEIRGGKWLRARRTIRAGTEESPADGFAAAAAAARCTARTPLCLSPAGEKPVERALRRGRIPSIVLALATLLIAVGARGLSAARQLSVDSRRLDALQAASAAWVQQRRSLAQADERLARVTSFRSARRSTVALLSALTTAMPESTAIVSLRCDSSGVNITVISTQAAAVLQRLARVPGVQAPRMVGSITREDIGGRIVRRAALRFRMGY